jgi:hypothetical protein
MPFFDDTGVDQETRRGPFWGAFATLRDQPERLVAVNIAWSIHLLPGIISFGFPEIPLVLRILLFVYSGVAMTPATALLYTLVSRAVQTEPLTLDMVRDMLRGLIVPSFRALGPLLGGISVLFWLAVFFETLPIDPAWRPIMLVASTIAQFMLLVGFTCAAYWGILFVEQPNQSALALLRRSLRVTLAYPGRTVMVTLASGLALVVGAFSVGGLFLIVPVVMALLQVHMYYDIKATKKVASPS